jgi:glycosyltransferase involved in cell wall biosynthesis
MRISIVTPSFNQAKFIEQTIRSVLDQDHDDIEHIVMDGGSTDGTCEILSRYPHLHWVSEQDRGQSDAINKGFRRSTGDILAWLNSDDWYEKNVLGDVARYFGTHPDCMMLYGDIMFVDKEGKKLISYTGDTINFASLAECPDIVRQPSFFWRKALFLEQGGVDESLNLVMDFDYFLRTARKYRLHYLPRTISCYRCYEQNKSLSMGRRQVLEMMQVYRKNRVRMTPTILRFLAVKFALSFGAVRTLHGIVRQQNPRAETP